MTYVVGTAPRRIVLVAAGLGGGGAERQLADMANFWAARELNVTLTTWSGPDVPDFYRLDSRIHRVYMYVNSPAGRVGIVTNLVSCVLRLRRLLRTVDPDVIVSFVAATNVLAILAAIGLRKRIIVSERAHPASDVTVTRPWLLLRRLLYRFADVVVAQTRDAAEYIHARYCRRVLVIPNSLHAMSPSTEARQPLVIAVGRLAWQKGFDVLLRAFAQLAGNYPEWNVVIIGEGPEHESLLALRDALGLGQRVKLAGQVHDIRSRLAHAGLVVQPSRFEGFPNAVLEAMGMGAAVIGADCKAGPSDLIQDGVNGRLVPVGDVQALATAMAELLSQPQLRARMGIEATKVRETYRQDFIMAKWEKCLFPSEASAS